MLFLESMGRHSDIEFHCLKEFSKSLSSRVYTWHTSLKLSIERGWTHLVYLFNDKFFYVDARFTLDETSTFM